MLNKIIYKLLKVDIFQMFTDIKLLREDNKRKDELIIELNNSLLNVEHKINRLLNVEHKINRLEYSLECVRNNELKIILEYIFYYYNYNNDINTIEKLNDYIKNIQNISGVFDEIQLKDSMQGLSAIFSNVKAFGDKSNVEAYYVWGMSSSYNQVRIIADAARKEKNVLYIEDGFIRSIVPFSEKKVDEKYRKSFSFTIDSKTAYINAFKPSLLEMVLNSDFELTNEERLYCREVMSFIIDNKISKYNHQPLDYKLPIKSNNKKNILIIDQSFGDFSIELGMADRDTFKKMYEIAIKENPNANIIVKTHPDALVSGGGRGYYTEMISHDNVYVIKDKVNPISMLQLVDSVYVCTSQLGLEALMCKKDVRVFGVPFYAGWGITKDYMSMPRRTRKRDLEEIFYIAYIMYSHYVDPFENKVIDIKCALRNILNLRNEYFKDVNEK